MHQILAKRKTYVFLLIRNNVLVALLRIASLEVTEEASVVLQPC